MPYPYETVGSLVAKLEKLDPNDSFNFNATKIQYIKTDFVLVGTDLQGTARYANETDPWDTLVADKGSSQISKLLAVLKPHLPKKSSAIVGYVLNGYLIRLMKSAEFKKETLYSGEDIELSWEATHLKDEAQERMKVEIEKAKVEKEKAEKRRSIQKIQRTIAVFRNATMEDPAMFKQFLPILAKKYPDEEVYLVGMTPYSSLEEAQQAHPGVSFTLVAGQVWTSPSTTYQIGETKYTRAELLKAYDLSDKLIERLFVGVDASHQNCKLPVELMATFKREI